MIIYFFRKFTSLLNIALFFVSMETMALRFPLFAHQSIFGKIQFIQMMPGDDLGKIAQRYDVGYLELLAANPYVDPKTPKIGTTLLLPTQFLLPRVKLQGIVINLGAMRLYYFPPKGHYFYTYPIGIGREDWGTPLGTWKVIQKIKKPVWIVPDSIFQFRATHGDPVPKVVPSGPDNPLGEFALRLSNPTYLIHGTNDPISVGQRSSAGCIHLYAKDIEQLFQMTDLHTPVLIINQPYILGWQGQHVYLEAHIPLKETEILFHDRKKILNDLLNELPIKNKNMLWGKADQVITDHLGLPMLIEKDNNIKLIKNDSVSNSAETISPLPTLPTLPQ